MPEIIPAILTSKLATLDKQLKASAEFGAKTVQIDFTDGQFVSSKTLLPSELATSSLATSSLIKEAHLMTLEPQQYYADLKKLAFKRVAIHYTAQANDLEQIQELQRMGFEAGLAINPDVPLESVENIIEHLDFILFLTVAPGEQGHDFEVSVLQKLQSEDMHALRKQHGHVTIEVDGGIKLDNIKHVLSAGATRIVVGSGIWRAPNPAQAYEALKKAAE